MPRRTNTGRQTAKRRRVNPLDAAGIAYIDYKDTDLLRKFVSDRGKIRSRRVTHVTRQQQRRIAQAIRTHRLHPHLPATAQAGRIT
ncbi:30S ribosomal protein S18 [Streptomyces spiralis]|uniref:30S ribosomal protein S18 n=1 Tax=Streptomyces spiralis TaxID=66376 RepID=UPI0033C1B0A3